MNMSICICICICFGVKFYVAFEGTMPCTSNSNRPTRNWLDLPSDVTANILSRVGVYDILENAQKVCTAWYEICKDPATWRVINVDYRELSSKNEDFFKQAVDRSQGQLIDITIHNHCDDESLEYVAARYGSFL